MNARLFGCLFSQSLAWVAPSYGQGNALALVNSIPPERMKQVYDEVKTPFKYGVVIHSETNQFVDFYCAVGDQGRVIALATPREMRR